MKTTLLVVAAAAMMLLVPAQALPTIGLGTTMTSMDTTSVCDIEVPTDYATIQLALNNAAAGQTVCVGEGTFVSPVIIPNRDGLSLIGAGAGKTFIDANQASSRGLNAEFSANAWNTGLHLEGFTLTNSTHFGVKLAWAQDVTIIDVHATGNGRTGIDLNTVADVTMTSVKSISNGGNGIAIRNADGVSVDKSTIALNAWGGLAFYAPGAETVNDVTVTDSLFMGEGKGIYFQYDGYTNIQIGVSGAGNSFSGNDVAVLVEDHPTFGTPDATGITLRANSLGGNDLAVANQGTGTLDAVGNFWGGPTGPVVPGVGGQTEGDVDYVLWCLLATCVI